MKKQKTNSALKNHIEFLKLAIANSKKSMQQGNFPAGAIVVKNGKILSSAVSVPYPGLFHADSRAVVQAFKKYGPLKRAALYIGLESCLMCTAVAYWSGIRKIIYAIPKSEVSGDYYETTQDTQKLFKTFNEKIEFVHLKKLKQEALDIIRQWEKKYLEKQPK